MRFSSILIHSVSQWVLERTIRVAIEVVSKKSREEGGRGAIEKYGGS